MSGPLFIASDLHGHAANTARLLAECRKQGGRLLLLGDLLGHRGRNTSWSALSGPPPVEEQLAADDLSILAVRGNCDGDFAVSLLPFPFHDSLTLVEDGRTFVCTHGHLFGEACPPRLREGAVLLTGHSHIPAWRDHGTWYYANPGSLGQPRGGAAESYMIYENGCFRWLDMAGQAWMEKKI